MKYTILILTFLVSAYNCQLVSHGRCQNDSVVSNFDIQRYSGLWYEIYRYPQIYEPGANCVTAQYTATEGGVEVFNKMVINGAAFSIKGFAKPDPLADGSGKLLVNFPLTGNNFSKYWVLSTDYDVYALVYTCTDLDDNKKRVSSWVLSRRPVLSPQAVLALDPSVKSSGLQWDSYEETQHSEAACKIN